MNVQNKMNWTRNAQYATTCAVREGSAARYIPVRCPRCHFGMDMLVNHLAQYIQPSQLRLSVICDTLGDATAMQIAQPLLKLPILAHCSLRLGQTPNTVFHILAEKTVLQATNRSIYHVDQPFRFVNLPDEI